MIYEVSRSDPSKTFGVLLRDIASESSEGALRIWIGTCVDSVHAAKIFTKILDEQDISYTVSVVIDKEDFEDYAEKLVAEVAETSTAPVFCINCTVSIDMVSILKTVQVPQELNFYVVDARQPYHLSLLSDQQNIFVIKWDLGISDEPNISVPDSLRNSAGEICPLLINDKSNSDIIEYYFGSYIGSPATILMLGFAQEIGPLTDKHIWYSGVVLGYYLDLGLMRYSRYTKYIVKLNEILEQVRGHRIAIINVSGTEAFKIDDTNSSVI